MPRYKTTPHTLPCGPGGKSLVPKNTMSSLEVLTLFLRAIRKKDSLILEALVASPLHFAWRNLKDLPLGKNPVISLSHNSPCVDEYIVGYSKTEIWLAVLERQYQARQSPSLGRYQLPPNSLYWRVVDFRPLNKNTSKKPSRVR